MHEAATWGDCCRSFLALIVSLANDVRWMSRVDELDRLGPMTRIAARCKDGNNLTEWGSSSAGAWSCRAETANQFGQFD